MDFNRPSPLVADRLLQAQIMEFLAWRGCSGYERLSVYLAMNGLTLDAPYEFSPAREVMFPRGYEDLVG